MGRASPSLGTPIPLSSRSIDFPSRLAGRPSFPVRKSPVPEDPRDAHAPEINKCYYIIIRVSLRENSCRWDVVNCAFFSHWRRLSGWNRAVIESVMKFVDEMRRFYDELRSEWIMICFFNVFLCVFKRVLWWICNVKMMFFIIVELELIEI